MIGLQATLNYFGTQKVVENTSGYVIFSTLKVGLCMEVLIVLLPQRCDSVLPPGMARILVRSGGGGGDYKGKDAFLLLTGL